MTPAPRPVRAFSLVELVTMLAVLGVLAAIAVPRYGNSLARYRASAAAGRIAADVNLARTRARTSSLGQSIVFSTASNAYTLPGVAGLRGQPSPYAVALSAEPYAATLVSAAFGAATTLAFDRYGQPTSGGTVVVRSGGVTKTVVVDPNTGQAAVQ